jgi:proline racemase
MKNISEDQVGREIKDEFAKDLTTLAQDITREANTHPDKPEGEKENLDIIKHLLKRMAIHQVSLQKQSKRTNVWLFVLSIIMAIGAVFAILEYFTDW